MSLSKMASPNVQQALYPMVWDCLSRTPDGLKATEYSVLFPDFEALQKAFKEASFTFAPGLLDAVQSDTPPTLAFFQSLPTETRRNGRDSWDVYALVLSKDGHRSKLYIGSGTNTQGGLFKRFNDYESDSSLKSEWIQKALDDGFTITSKGLLGWCKQPIELHAYVVHDLNLLLEALFTFVFWAFRSRLHNYGYPDFCPWDKANVIAYDGLCSHSPINEAIRTRNAPLPPGIEKWSRPKRYSCIVCDSHWESESDLKKHKLTQKHLNKVAGINNAAEITRYLRGWGQQNIADKRYNCTICDKAFGTSTKLDIHYRTEKHKRNAAEAAEVASASGSSS